MNSQFNSIKLTLLFPVLTLCAVGAVSAQSVPWHNRAVTEHVDINLIQGELSNKKLDKLIRQGRVLFKANFTREDGVGRPMATQAIIPTKRKRPARHTFSRTAGLDANACSSCHNQPLVGGAGDFSTNVFVSEGFQLADFDSIDPQFSNERNTNHLFGAGLVELLAREMSRDLIALRTNALLTARSTGQDQRIALISKGIEFGFITASPDGLVKTNEIDGVDTDLIIKPFSQKGVMTSLRQFTVNALNHHHGMQATERFGSRWTGTDDFDEDGFSDEITSGDISALVAWQATLEPPQKMLPESLQWQAAAQRGQQVFQSLGCEQCHRPTLPLDSLMFEDPGPFDVAGTLRKTDIEKNNSSRYEVATEQWLQTLEQDEQGRWLVPLFGDLKRHVIADKTIDSLGNELLSQRFVERNVFMTAELWGVGSTAPYGHRGNMTTLPEVIAAHGGAARKTRDAYMALKAAEQSDIDAFLKTLIISEQ